ncbi:MAG TPA: RnfABCDGE type electron transport complex subunit B [Caldimonas sp.]|nr:RnfABCDGE type electron transport complex subunit B [Caldimonas sp.]
MGGTTVEAVLEVLPQTQCRRCGYDDCRAYAHAIVVDGADVNRCPPGGAEGIDRLARLTGRPAVPLDASCGTEAPRALALVDEAWCIGCALCLKACPIDAIVGTAKRMHVVIEELCTGCELCVPVCPVDCIAMIGATGDRTGWQAWDPARAAQARSRYERHAARIDAAAETPSATAAAPPPRQETIAAVLARARESRTR